MKKRNGVVYRSYSFTTQDPIIDRVHMMVKDSGKSQSKIYKAGGPSTTTMTNWFSRKTRRPQFCTIAATIRALGGDIGYRTADGTWMSVMGRRINPNGKYAKSTVSRSAQLH